MMMYTLYATPGTCSTGIHILLTVLEQEFELVYAADVDNFNEISPTGMVPVLADGDFLIREGGAIVLYLLEKHNSTMLSADPIEKSRFLQKLLFNYPTMHLAYSKLFFAMKNLSSDAQRESYEAAARDV